MFVVLHFLWDLLTVWAPLLVAVGSVWTFAYLLVSKKGKSN